MEIKLTGKTLSKSILDQHHVKWKLNSKNIKVLIVIFGIGTLVSVIIGLVVIGKYSMINLVENKIYFNLNLFFSLAFSSLLLWLYFLNLFKKNKKMFLEGGRLKAEKYKSLEEINVNLRDKYIEIDDGLRNERIHWTLFTNVIYFQGFIFLCYSLNPLDSVTLDIKMISQKDLEGIKKVLAQKIK